MNVLILGASYGSLLSTKLLMAGHHVTLMCLQKEADLINRVGTEVRLKLRNEDAHRSIRSNELPGSLDAVTPSAADLSRYDMVGLAMQDCKGRTAVSFYYEHATTCLLAPYTSTCSNGPLALLSRRQCLGTLRSG